MNGYSNTGFTHTLNGIYSISDGAGTTIEGGEITTSNITTTDLTTTNLTTNLLKINCGTGGECIDLGAGDTDRPTDSLYGKIFYRTYGGVVIFGDDNLHRVDIFNNLYVHGNMNIDATFYVAEIYCPSIFAQNTYLTLNSSDNQDIIIGFYKVSSGNVVINKSCNPSCKVNIEQGSLNVMNGPINASGSLNALSTFVCSGTATFNSNVVISGTTTMNKIITNLIDISSSSNDAYLFPTAVGIYIGSTENTITYIRCYLDCLQFAIFRTGLSAYDTSTFQGITNDFSPIQNNLATDASSLTSTASTIINGGLIIKKNTYAKDMMTDSIATGDIACGNVNSSNGITCPKVICDKINCKTVIAEDVYYKNKICGYINLGIAPYLKIPLTTSLLDTTTSITNFDLSTYLTNANNNTIFLLPYYNVIFYNNDVILTIVDNSAGIDTLFFQNIQFDQNLTCTKIIIQYKNMTLL